jgi:hypothetical protein
MRESVDNELLKNRQVMIGLVVNREQVWSDEEVDNLFVFKE